MRLFISFFLALFVYSFIIFAFLYLIFQKKNISPKKIVYVHQVIQTKKKSQPIIKQPKKTQQKIVKKTQQEIKTKYSFSKGGEDIKLDDIFANINDNIPTQKIKVKKQKNMTKKVSKHNIEKVKKILSQLQTTTSISNLQGSKKDLDYIQNEFARIWTQIDTNVGDFVSLQINIQNGVINVIVLATNLDTIRLNQFLNDLKSINTSKINNFKAVIDFKSKLKG